MFRRRAMVLGIHCLVRCMLLAALAASFTASGAAQSIFWSDYASKSIYKADLDGSHVSAIATGADYPRGIDVDMVGGKIYWADYLVGKVERANYDGSNKEDVIFPGRPSGQYLNDIAIDHQESKIYWTSSSSGDSVIRRANLDGSQVEDLVSTTSSLAGLALDLTANKMYWPEYDSNRIRRANLDGSDVEELVTGLSRPRQICLDLSGERMFWTELGSATIKCASLDGSNTHSVVTQLTYPNGIALFGDKVYWADANKIQRANLNGTLVETLTTVGVSFYSGDLAVVPIPEPSTFVLLGVGAISLPGCAWRRRRLGV